VRIREALSSDADALVGLFEQPPAVIAAQLAEFDAQAFATVLVAEIETSLGATRRELTP